MLLTEKGEERRVHDLIFSNLTCHWLENSLAFQQEVYLQLVDVLARHVSLLSLEEGRWSLTRSGPQTCLVSDC